MEAAGRTVIRLPSRFVPGRRVRLADRPAASSCATRSTRRSSRSAATRSSSRACGSHVGVYPHPESHACGSRVAGKAGSRRSRSTGSGRKHERPIVLESWQQDIVRAHPWTFLRGLAALGRVPNDQPVQDQAAARAGGRVRVSALVLLEYVGGHPRAVLRDVRAGRHPVDAVQPPQHLGLASPQRRAAGRARGAEDVTYHERLARGRGGIGRHAGLRSRCRKAWGFESLRPHRRRQTAGPHFAGARSHSETWAGCIVSSTTVLSSLTRLSRSTSSRSRALNASRVTSASYLLR